VKIIVFGASKGVGREIVREALSRGHQVTAFSRSEVPATPNLTVIRGDVLEPAVVSDVLEGYDAVVCALGAGNTASDTRSRGTQNILDGMKAHGLKRLICISSFAVGDSRKGFFANLVWLFLGKALTDHERQEALIRAVDLDWTVIRPTRLVDEPKRSSYRTGDLTVGFGAQISRADVADFALETLEQGKLMRRAATITG
jgi:putative NADH-flavin reductase